jgi:hypothetical protein
MLENDIRPGDVLKKKPEKKEKEEKEKKDSELIS